MSGPTSRPATVQHLAQQLRRWERAHGGSRQTGRTLSTGIEPLDRLLPDGGVAAGTLVEWLSEGAGGGAATLALAVAGPLAQNDKGCVVIDPSGTFYPPALWHIPAAEDGTPGAEDRAANRSWFSRPHAVFVVHPSRDRDTLWAWEQSLRCSGVAVVVGWVGELNDRFYRRLQLAAESGGGIGLLLRPSQCRRQRCWADVRLLVEALPGDQHPVDRTGPAPSRRLRVELLSCRGRLSGGAIELEIDDETGDVHLASRLASAADSSRPADSRRAAGA